MNATSIVLLIGVCSLWVVVGVLFTILGRARKVLEDMGKTLGEIRSDVARLTPVLSDTLQGVEKTGLEVGQTATEIGILTRRINSGSAASVASSTISYLPVALALLKVAKPLFEKMRNRKQ